MVARKSVAQYSVGKDESLNSNIYLPSESSRFSSNTLSTVRKCSFSPPVVPLLKSFDEEEREITVFFVG